MDKNKMDAHRRRMQLIDDMEFEHLMLVNHWPEEEREKRRKVFDREKRKEKKLNSIVTDYLMQRPGQPEYEKVIAKKHLEEHPEDKIIFDQLLDAIVERSKRP